MIDLFGNLVFWIYYILRFVLFILCVGNEFFYCFFYLFYFFEGFLVGFVGLFWMGFWVIVFIVLLKLFISVIYLIMVVCNMVVLDVVDCVKKK